MLPSLPAEVDAALGRKASAEGKSVDEIAIAALRDGLGLRPVIGKRRDLSHLAGTWVEDPEFDAVMEEQDRVDPKGVSLL